MQSFMCFALRLSFLIQWSCGSRLQIEKLSVNSNRNALDCLETVISDRYWLLDDILIISNEMDFFDNQFFQRFPYYRWKLHSVRNDNLTGFSNVIFFTSDFDSFRAAISAINIQRMDSRARFVIIVSKKFASLDEIKKASKGIPALMWKLDKTRVVYLVPCKKIIFAMTYFPFANNCQVGELEVLDIWKGKDFENGVELFPNKMLNIHGCVQNHTVAFPKGSALQLRQDFTETGEMVLGGIGGRLITIVAEKMNMNLSLVIQPSETWASLVGQVIRGESLLSICGTVPLIGQVEVLDIDSGYMEESYGIGYKIRAYEVPWKNLFSPLSRKVWQWIGYTGLLFCSLLIAANRCHRSKYTSDKLGLLNSFGIFVGNTRVLPRSCFGRYTFGIWIIYSYLINVTYNSELVSFLTTSSENNAINTFEELLADGIEFGGGNVHREFYHDPSDPVMMKIYNNFKFWPENESLDRLMNGQATGVLQSYVFMNNGNQTGNGKRVWLRMLKDKAFTYHVPISMRRGSPFVLGVRRYTSQAIQGGFREYWLRYYTRKSSFSRIGSNALTVISMQHIRGTLYLFIAGLIFSCVFFFGELIFYYYF